MPEEAKEPKKEKTDEKTKDEAASPFEINEITSLEDLADEPPTEPDPVEIIWGQGRKIFKMMVKVKRPGRTQSEFEDFPIEYMQARRLAQTPQYADDKKAEPEYPNEGAEMELLRQECIIEPEFLKVKGIDRSGKLAPEFWAQLHRKLLLVAGVDGDFFADWNALQTPKALLAQLTESLRKQAGSSRMKSLNDAEPPPAILTPPSSPPTTAGPGSDTSSSEPSTSKTNSGSSSPSRPLPEKTTSPRPTEPSATSLESAPSSQEKSKSPSSQTVASTSASGQDRPHNPRVKVVRSSSRGRDAP